MAALAIALQGIS